MNLTKKKKRSKIKPKKLEPILIGLHEITRSSSPDKDVAASLLSWHQNGGMTQKQVDYARILISKSKRKKKEKPKKYYLYAIGDGESVKLGLSTNINGRLKSMQTGHPKKLVLLWKYYIGRDKKSAYQLEKKLHRFCKKYHIRGEWFKAECEVLVKQFSLHGKLESDDEQERHDLKLLSEAPF